MDYLEEYTKSVANIINYILGNERRNIERAAELIADAVKKGGLIHVFGTGAHSSMAGEEAFWRPGSLAAINPVFDSGLTVHHGAWRCEMIENVTGYSKALLDYYKINKDDVMIIVDAPGVNSVTIEAAIEAKNKGTVVIAVTSRQLSASIPIGHPQRHPGGQCLYALEAVDVVIDSHVPVGDCLVEHTGIKQKTGPVSTIANSTIIGLLNVNAIEKLLDRGVKPEIVMDRYSLDGLEHNEEMAKKYMDVIKHL